MRQRGLYTRPHRSREIVTDLEFSADCSCLNISLGHLTIQPSLDTVTPSPTGPETNMFLVEGQWVTLGREKTVWLPPENQPICSAVKDNTLALGHESGRVPIIKFCA